MMEEQMMQGDDARRLHDEETERELRGAVIR